MKTRDIDSVTRFRVVRKHPVVAFFIFAYVIGIGALLPAQFFNIPQLALLGASSSSVAGVITAALCGKMELKNLFKSVVKFKCGVLSYIYSMIIPTAIVFAAILINSLLGNPHLNLAGKNWIMLIPYLVFFSIQAGLGEELGWRGFALPKLLSSGKSVLAASLIVGVAWAFWHTPLFFIPGVMHHYVSQQIGFLYTFAVYALSVISASVISSWLYLRSGKSLVIPILMHGTSNLWGFYTRYADFNAYGGFTVMYASTLLHVLVALFVILRSPYFNKSNAISLEVEKGRSIV